MGALALALAWLLQLAQPTSEVVETAGLVHALVAPADRLLVAAICLKESGAGTARGALSRCGTKIRGRYVTDPRRSVEIAARSIARWRRRCRGDVRRALVAYRLGEGCLARDRTGYASEVLGLEARLGALMPRARRAIRRGTALPPD